MRFEGGRIEEHGRAVDAARLLQRGGDEIADSPGRENVLGRKQPIVACKVHPSPDSDRFAEQPGPLLAGGRRVNRVGEEDPDVSTGSGSGHLKCSRDPYRACSLQVRQGVEHGRGTVEVCGQPPAPIPVKQRVQPYVDPPQQVRFEDIRCASGL